MKFSDKDILDGLLHNNNAIVAHIYSEYFPYTETFILANGGSHAHAEDIFQDALIIIYRKVEKDGLELYCKFGTYIYAVCKKLWIQEQRKKQLRNEKLREYSSVAEPKVAYETEAVNDEKELVEKHLLKLSPDCQKMLRLYFNDIPVKEISRIMGIDNIAHTTDKKYRCKKKLIEKVKADPFFRRLKK